MELVAADATTQLEHEAIRDQLDKAKSNLDLHLGTINHLADQLYGDSHGPAEIDVNNPTAQARPARAGLVGQIRDDLDSLEDLIEGVTQALSRLQR